MNTPRREPLTPLIEWVEAHDPTHGVLSFLVVLGGFFGLVFVMPVVASLPMLALMAIGGTNALMVFMLGSAVVCTVLAIGVGLWSWLRSRQAH